MSLQPKHASKLSYRSWQRADTREQAGVCHAEEYRHLGPERVDLLPSYFLLKITAQSLHHDASLCVIVILRGIQLAVLSGHFLLSSTNFILKLFGQVSDSPPTFPMI